MAGQSWLSCGGTKDPWDLPSMLFVYTSSRVSCAERLGVLHPQFSEAELFPAIDLYAAELAKLARSPERVDLLLDTGLDQGGGLL